MNDWKGDAQAAGYYLGGINGAWFWGCGTDVSNRLYKSRSSAWRAAARQARLMVPGWQTSEVTPEAKDYLDLFLAYGAGVITGACIMGFL